MLPTIKRRFIIAMNSILFIAPLKHNTRNPNVHMNGKEGRKKRNIEMIIISVSLNYFCYYANSLTLAGLNALNQTNKYDKMRMNDIRKKNNPNINCE